MPNFVVRIADFDSPEEENTLSKGGGPLRTLCRNEVESFDEFLKGWSIEDPQHGSEYSDGLALWEKRVIEGYLYQKSLGRF